jgi:Pectate lyase superfamily protein
MIRRAYLAGTWAFLLLGTLSLTAQIIPSSRSVQWSPGLSFRGGIPNRTSLINVKNPPYRAKGDGKSDDTAAIQAALNTARPKQVVYLPASTYLISNTLFMNNPNISIRGDGPASTILKYIGGSGDIIQAVPWLTGFSSSVAITSACNKGATRITVADAGGIQVGDILVISELNPSYATATGADGICTWCGADDYNGSGNDQGRLLTQVDRVTSISGNTVTLERALYLTFPASNSPAVQDMTPTYGIGVENLQVYRVTTGTRGGYNIEMGTVAECWIKNVASINTTGAECDAHVFLSNTYACEVRECWIQGGRVNASGQDYGVYVEGVNSDELIEDNVLTGCRHSLVVSAGGSGNVFGYNYCVGNFESDGPADYQAEDIDCHGGEPYMNLFEGNVTGQLAFDNVWGGNAYNTAFRCWVLSYSSGNTQPEHNRVAVDLEQNTYAPNIVGCVLGRPRDKGSTDYAYGTAVQSTTYLHGDYSYVTGQTIWSTGVTHVLPPSLYLYGKPSWWGSAPFPAIGPDCNSMDANIPAATRYNGHM